ncbi:hypothetical protein A4G19_03860 [Pasteurellaceae bacterium Macca]|nr:hypothetical protein [Pasteurellaceae bacterium Macca]
MLYTFANAQYDRQTLATLLTQVKENDAVLLWQDGVLQAVKNPQLFAHLKQCYLLENDVKARGIQTDLPTISLAEFVHLTEDFFPQVAL